MENLERIWQEAASHLEESLPETKKQWIQRISYGGEENGVLILALSSAFYRDTAEKNCRTDIENMVSEANKTQFDSIINYVKGQDSVINTKIDNNYNALLTRIQALENKLGVTGGDDNKYDELLARIEALENKKELALTRINLYNE